MAYSDDIDALSPDHRWAFNGSSGTDSVGSATATMTGTVAATAISEDVSNSAQTNAIAGDRMSLGSITTIGNSAHSRKSIGGWFQISKVDAHPARIYGEGDADPTFQFIMAMGNNLMLETVDGGTSVQVYGLALAVDRPYHIYGELQGDGYNDTLRLYVDGVLQESIAFGSTTLTTRGLAEFADPAGTVGVGGDIVLLQAPVNGSYNQWASWANKTLPTTTEIREELFEKGALPDVTITNQAGLDALADTVRGNTPLSILVNVAGNISLSADNVTFDPLCSIHVQYNGTGTLTWTNTNGANASIGSTTSTGSIVFVNPATLTINGVINGAEVRIYDNETADDGSMNTELDGIESNTGTSFVFSHSGATNDIMIQMMADGYEEVIENFSLIASDQTLTLFPVVETNT